MWRIIERISDTLVVLQHPEGQKYLARKCENGDWWIVDKEWEASV